MDNYDDKQQTTPTQMAIEIKLEFMCSRVEYYKNDVIVFVVLILSQPSFVILILSDYSRVCNTYALTGIR